MLARAGWRDVYFAFRTLAAIFRHPVFFFLYWWRFFRARFSGRPVVVFRSFHPSDALTFADLPKRLVASGRYEVAVVSDHAASGPGSGYPGCSDFLSAVRADLFVLCTSNTRRFIPGGAQVLFLFPSLAGLDGLYPVEAFDAYHAFFCAGPHQRDEMSERLAARGIAGRHLFNGGYPKLDHLRAQCGGHAPKSRDTAPQAPTVLYAPTHSHKNPFSSLPVATRVIRSLRDRGFRVVFRPHPKSFGMDEERPVLQEILATFREDSKVELDREADPVTAYSESDMVVSDGTGVGFSYALATDRPALFLDRGATGRGFHFERRDQVGRVCGDPDAVGEAAASLLAESDAFRASIAHLRDEMVFHAGDSAREFEETVEALVSGRHAPSASHCALRATK